ncbi:MAG: histidine--tRNA ligase [Candidatus Dadabacteria bacterium]|nr:MAG: histidine--tRNA ligase [Candidatus Dadabacteria bacterium]
MATTQYRSVKGMPDLLPAEARQVRELERIAATFFEKAGFQELRTPILEAAELFSRAVGESSDIVRKEMYHLTDLGGRELVLRPEGTAPIVRAVLQHKLVAPGEAARLWYVGPMFRQENTQKGRQRQFVQIGAEWFGAGGPWADAETIGLNVRLLEAFSVNIDAVEVNSLGNAASRLAYREKLVGFLDKYAEQLCADCKERRQLNPLRVLDCKNQQCQAIYADAPVPLDALDEPSRQHFDAVCQGLETLRIEFVVNARLVRGLDYYSDTVFELKSSRLGAQATVSAGGRYDSLVESFGGPPTPAVGFAAGVERILLAREAEPAAEMTPDVVWIALDEPARREGLGVVDQLRAGGMVALQLFHKGSVKAQMRGANQLGARFAVLCGDDERARAVWAVRDLQQREQFEVPATPEALIRELRARSA